MKKNYALSIIGILGFVVSGFSQSYYYDLWPGNGNGVRFWASDTYKIHMGSGSEYFFGTVSDYAMKFNMGTSEWTNRGWVWGQSGITPIASLNIQGNMQIAGSFTSPAVSAGPMLNGTNSDFESLSIYNTTASNLSSGNGAVIQFYNNSNNSNGLKGSSIKSVSSDGYFGWESDLYFRTTRNNSYSSQTILDAMIIKGGSGNVGIGTTSPGSALSVKGRVGIRADGTPTTPAETLRVEGAMGAEESVMNVTNMADQDFMVRLSGGGTAFGSRRTIIGPSVASRFSLGVGVNGGNEYLTIINGGNVGIGTTQPDSKLAVNGSVHATEVKVTSTVPGPDYVFEKSYTLPTLAQVRSYIEQNKHLPEIPSAVDMEANGIKLGEMNMLLLKKVEELTLYVIELKERNDKLEERIIGLERK